MIVQLKGNVNYPITLDPTVWIFDDRKVVLEEAFLVKNNSQLEVDHVELSADRWGAEVYEQRARPPVNKSITKFEREKILSHSFLMPIEEFIGHAEVKQDAKNVTLVTSNGEITISLSQLKDSYLLFAIKGKPVIENGPVHLYFKDGSNKENPIEGVKNIIIN